VLDRDTVARPANPIDDARYFVRMQYVDLLNREPDVGGWDYWTNEITSCPPEDTKCVGARRSAVSAAFFIEPEFQETGYFVLRFGILNPVSYSRYVGFFGFAHDVQTITSGALGQPDPEAKLEANKRAFIQQYFDEDRVVYFGFTNVQYVLIESLFGQGFVETRLDISTSRHWKKFEQDFWRAILQCSLRYWNFTPVCSYGSMLGS